MIEYPTYRIGPLEILAESESYMTLSEAKDFCWELDKIEKGWRLPTAKEFGEILYKLYELEVGGFRREGTKFGYYYDWHWTSDKSIKSGKGIGFSFENNGTTSLDDYRKLFVRPVKSI